MQYQVPQFIEIEDKIFGPLTIKQFVYLAGGTGLCLIFFTLLPLYLTVVLSIPVMAFAAALAFYQVNGRPFIIALEHAFGYFLGGKLYLWKQRPASPQATQDTHSPSVASAKAGTLIVPKLSQSKLKDIAWSLNIKDQSQGKSEPPSNLAI